MSVSSSGFKKISKKNVNKLNNKALPIDLDSMAELAKGL
jgi:hypothetical protein